MAMQAFQRALCDLVASPQLCLLMRGTPDVVLERYNLSDRERRRLIDVVSQKGMSVNCTLYRFNRITPIYTLMPLTAFLLGDDFVREALLFWEQYPETRLQFKQEVAQFGQFLLARIAERQIEDPLLEDLLAFELATNELRFQQRRRIQRELERSKIASAGSRLHLHPLLRVVLFQHEPSELLRLANERRRPPETLAEGEFWLLLDARSGELEVKLIDPELGRLLAAVGEQAPLPIAPEDVEILIEADLVVRVGISPVFTLI